MSELPITEDLRRLGEVCRLVGYITGLADQPIADEYGDIITEYIAELFTAKRGETDVQISQD